MEELFSRETTNPKTVCFLAKIPVLDDPAFDRHLQSSMAKKSLRLLQKSLPHSKFHSISHTHGCVVSVVSPTRTGIDIETRSRKASRALTRIDYPLFLNQKKPLQTWTLLEATLKMNHLGLGRANQIRNRPYSIIFEAEGWQLALAHSQKIEDVYLILMGFGTRTAKLKIVENTTKARVHVFNWAALSRTSARVARLKNAIKAA